MADEQTPLIQVVQVAPPHQRYSHSIVRRFCTVALASTLLVIVILFLLPVRWLPGSGGHLGHNEPWDEQLPHQAWPGSNGLSYDELMQVLMDTPDADKIRSWSQYYTAGPHLAGKNLSQAVQTMEWWREFGIQADIVSYDVYINYPAGHALKMVDDKGKTLFEATLEEDVLEDDPTTGQDDRIPTFHGYSASGNVTGPMVYINFCTVYDFDDLVKAGVELEGKIALCKYGRVFRGLKVKRAQELGMLGVVMYDDPQLDGSVTEANGLKPYPEGPARNPSSVQRGSVQFLSIAPGDPTTPGYPSLPGAPRKNVSGAIPDIPSLPVSYREALPLLKALNGHGPKANEFNEYWQGGGLAHKGVDYNIGPSEVEINLVNQQDYVTTPLWNVIGVINGTISDEVLVLGNHRDAWLVGGAGDPNSGSAAMNELIRSFGVALSKGWKPLRTIVFASWDGEEYGLIGSTEWVEEYLPWLSGSAVAYINVDVGTRGPEFQASASPLLNRVLYEATAQVLSPNQTVAGQTVGDLWDKAISTMGSGSDFTAFQDFAGIPSLDMGFAASAGSAVYHYHSNYDSFYWMDTFGDHDWAYHVTMAKVWAAVTVYLSERPVLPLNATDYADGLKRYLTHATEKAQHALKEGSVSRPKHRHSSDSTPFANIRAAVADLRTAAYKFDEHAQELVGEVEAGVPWWQFWKRMELYRKVRKVNTQLKAFERHFLHQPGLDSRSWFKHVVFAPGLWTGYTGETFPGLIEGIDRRDWKAVDRWSEIIEALVREAAQSLRE